MEPTFVGCVAGVSGSAVTIRQEVGITSGIAIVGGKTYRIGQVGSFVRIPQGYQDLYGVVIEVGVSETHDDDKDKALLSSTSERTILVQLVGELVNGYFERGITQYPNVNDAVHLVVEEDLRKIYQFEERGQVVVGRLASADGVAVQVDVDKLVTRHSAILGSTGSGKSTTVASLLRALAKPGAEGENGYPSSRILLIDIHGEYTHALSDLASVYKIGASEGQRELLIPFWALEAADLLEFLMGRLDDRVVSQISERVFGYKLERVRAAPIPGVEELSLTADSPVPFSLKRLWFELLDPEIRTWANTARTERAILEEGDEDTLRPPRYHPHSNTNTPPFLNNIGVLGIRRGLDQMRTRLLDTQYQFLLRPGDWEPDHNGVTAADLDVLLRNWLGHEKPITILDLSGVPSPVLVRLIGAILRIIYEALFWGRARPEGGRKRPLLVVMEEAHRYLGSDDGGIAREMVQRIVKEGRKFGVGAMIVSQRPSEVDETVLSQCGTFVALRMANAADRNRVQSTLPDSLAGLAESLPVLRTGEAVITGEAAKLPIRCRVMLPPENERPLSEDPPVSESWSKARGAEDYSALAAVWRAQNPLWEP